MTLYGEPSSSKVVPGRKSFEEMVSAHTRRGLRPKEQEDRRDRGLGHCVLACSIEDGLSSDTGSVYAEEAQRKARSVLTSTWPSKSNACQSGRLIEGTLWQ